MKVIIYGNNMSAMGAAGVLARTGNAVYLPISSHDLDSRRISVTEPGLRGLLQSQFDSGRLRSYDPLHPPADADIHWLTLESQEYEEAAKIVADVASRHEGPLLFINQSIFGIGSTSRLNAVLGNDEHRTVVYVPDSLRGGRALESFIHPDQLVIGSDSQWAISKITAMSRVLMGPNQRIRIMTPQEAEFATLALNGMLAMRLSYINELANLADSMGIDIETVRDTIAGDTRIGKHFLNPGCGFGGEKFSDHLLLFSDFLKEKRRSSLLRTVIDINERQKETLFRKLWRHFQGNLKGCKVAIWGASYKSGTADIHNAPSLATIDACMAQGVEVRVHDPLALQNLAEHYKNADNLVLCSTPEQAADGADALLLITEWPEYGMRDFDRIVSSMRRPLLLDGRNVYDPGEMKDYGFHYHGIGRKAF
ncbi:UDP-glucose/GDP-mannose dehydrogenase family protein [Pontibacterium sp. N1Y112]|uniref:UDP-glucose 6-dehydrogenase n=1 Tax=Pontibacterium sinense TaxID=2781979 RepID=A0A8J7F7B4_9GAMM|nr:nucleotide sugar dehydrogenase [Pontibacterium sinense]MBE9396430.1 UDP-glucose/GDP-mannose dehydrogenase family protein [Pontibacterium sinense]